MGVSLIVNFGNCILVLIIAYFKVNRTAGENTIRNMMLVFLLKDIVLEVILVWGKQNGGER